MKNHVKVEGNPSLVRDINTHAILNTDSYEIRLARERKAQRLKEKKKFEALQSDVDDIKIMLARIMDKLDGS